ncbi:MAG: CHASE domain-containing protein [Azovibrio sp.]|nr:CHASE domain-containing protein [Azovibrio sp.]
MRPALRLPTNPLLALPAGRWLLTGSVFLAILLASLGLAQHLHRQDTLERQTRFSLDAALVTVEIRDRLRHHAQFLYALRAFVSSMPRLRHADWQRFSTQLDIAAHLPGLHAYGYLPAVPSTALARFEQHARQDLGRPDYTVQTTTDLPVRFPVLYVTPMQGNNLKGLGRDLASEPTRWEAMQYARYADTVSMTHRLQLIPDQDGLPRPGIILFLPIYAEPQPHANVEARRQALAGYVFAAYRISDLMQTLNHVRKPHLALQIFDDQGFISQKGGQQLELLHDTHPERRDWPADSLKEERELSFGARTWVLHFEDPSTPPWLSWHNPAVLTLAAGTGLASLAALLLWLLATQGQRAQTLAQGMTQALEQSQQRFRLAAEGASDGIWYRDFRTGEFFVSDRGIRLLGYDETSFTQTDAFFLDLVHPEDRLRRRQAMEAHLKHRAPYDIEVRLKRGDGQWHWFNLKGQAIWDAHGQALLMAGSFSDIHARKAAEIELRQHRDRLQELVEERTQRLEAALEEARQAARAKAEFLANMSHELRTPLHAMLGFASIGLNKSEGQEKIHRYFARIQQSAERLLSLVNDLLDLAKLEAGKMEVRPELTEIRPILQQVIGELDPLLHPKNLRVDIVERAANSLAFADPRRIEQVLNNLLSNAIRFSPEGGLIRFTLYADTLPRGRRATDQGRIAALTLTVEDEGPGIPETELERIFDKFAQSSRTRTGAGGTGLGLAICREIVAAHRGRIHAENRSEGGARLVLTLPAEPQAPAPEDTSP